MSSTITLDRDSLNKALLSASLRRDSSDCNIAGLWPDLSTASSVLRIANSIPGILDANQCCVDDDGIDGKQVLDNFFNLLLEVEEDVRNTPIDQRYDDNAFVIAIEGLDGCGKSTLVRRLANELSSTTPSINIDQVHICATPTASISNVRPVFDKAGGSIARAFYMCSNYILQYEIRKACKQQCNDEKISVFIVDRWYSSTCAYTIGYKNTNGLPKESIDLLPDSLFKWPRDLSPPDLMLILEVDDNIRIERVSDRANRSTTTQNTVDDPPQASRNNPWDERLSNDTELGQRIISAHHRSLGPLCIKKVDANKTPDEVVRNVLDIATTQLMDKVRASFPMTVVLTGSHCSGKTSLGKLLSGYLGWQFDPEIGDIQRDKDSLVAGGHLSGDGSGKDGDDWDTFVHEKECERDSWPTSCNRVVETWHLGNLVWALLRLSRSNSSSGEKITMLKARTEHAIQKEMKYRNVVCIHLQTSAETTVRRRQNQPDNALRLPMKNEKEECTNLCTFLDKQVIDLLNEHIQKKCILVLNNDEDGEEAMGQKVSEIASYLDNLK